MCAYDVLLQPRASVVLEQNFKSSKFYELVALRKPIFYLGDESDLGDFITKENIGVALYKDAEIERKVTELIEIIYSKKQINKLFDIHSYSFFKQTEFLKTIIK
ncbi:MAG: hypothetical protein J0M08_11350, partial [Bacteroidetes bacterium]|nr:hypothetical protein [Bacteroidota bacterium]